MNSERYQNPFPHDVERGTYYLDWTKFKSRNWKGVLLIVCIFLGFSQRSISQEEIAKKIGTWYSMQQRGEQIPAQPSYPRGKDGVDLAVSDILSSGDGFETVKELNGLNRVQFEAVLDSLISMRMYLEEFIIHADTFIYTTISDGADDLLNYPYYNAFERSEENKTVLMEFLLESPFLSRCDLLAELTISDQRVLCGWLSQMYSSVQVIEQVSKTSEIFIDSFDECLEATVMTIFKCVKRR